MNNGFGKRRIDNGPRLNNNIRVPEVRVIKDDNQVGVMPTYQALKMAEESGLDLVEISPQARPPVCLIVDYGKYKFEEAKKKQARSKNAKITETKEIRVRPKIEEHDINFKVNHIRRFIGESDKVRVVVQYKGRENAHPETGKVVLDRIISMVSDIAQVETQPSMEERKMIMILAPK